MDFQNRKRDLTEVFNHNYNANHDYNNIKQNINNQNDFMRKMYNMPEKQSAEIKREVKSTREETIQRLNGKMNSLNNINRLNK